MTLAPETLVRIPVDTLACVEIAHAERSDPALSSISRQPGTIRKTSGQTNILASVIAKMTLGESCAETTPTGRRLHPAAVDGGKYAKLSGEPAKAFALCQSGPGVRHDVGLGLND